jgi:hypothetical protein
MTGFTELFVTARDYNLRFTITNIYASVHSHVFIAVAC